MMNNAIAIVTLIVLVVLAFVILKTKISEVTGKVSKLPMSISLVVFVFALVIVVLLVKYLLGNKIVHGNPGNVDATVTEEGNSYEDENELEAENTIILSGDQIWIDGEKVDIDEAEMHIEGFSGTVNELIIIDDYSTAYLHHRIEDICKQKNVTPEYIEKDENHE